MPRGGGNNLIDQQTQTPGEGVTVALRTQLKNATRNIKNRWSSSGADGTTPSSGNLGTAEEAQALLSKAAEVPNDTPAHQPRRSNLHNVPPPPYPPPVAAIPPTSQLQRAINHTLQSSSESKMLSKPCTSVKDRAETIC